MKKSLIKTCFLIAVIIIFIIYSINNDDAESLRSDSGINTDLPLGIFLSQKGNMADWNDATLLDSVRTAKTGGISLAVWTEEWGSIELQRGVYEWNLWDYITDFTEDHGLKLSMALELAHIAGNGNYPDDIVFNNNFFEDDNNDGVPNEGSFAEAFLIFTDRFVKRYKGKLDYLWLGQEVDYYLYNHSDQKESFFKLYDRFDKTVKSVDPKIKTGIVGSYHLALSAGEDQMNMLKACARESEVIALTVYPQDSGSQTPPVSDIKSYFSNLINAFPDSKIAIHETAWSSSGKGSTESAQTEYLVELSKFVKENSSRFEMFSLYILYDFSSSDNITIADSYGMSHDEDFLKFHGSMGLINNEVDDDGKIINSSAKPSWTIWIKNLFFLPVCSDPKLFSD